MKSLSRLIVLATALLVIAPSQAQACPAIIGPLCTIIGGTDILKAITGRVQIYVQTLLSEIDNKHAQKLAESMGANDLKNQRAGQFARAARERSSSSGASCAIQTIGNDFIRGGRRNSPAIDPEKPFGGDSNTSPARHDYKPPSTRGSAGYMPSGKRIAEDQSTANIDPEVFQRSIAEERAVTAQMRRDNTLPGSGDQWQDAKTQFDAHMNYYSNEQDELFYNADIKVQTILDNDTFPPTLDLKTNSVNLMDAAYAYCKNLAEPVILAPNRGAAKAEDLGRIQHSNERAAWDARLSLARSICDEAVTRRTGKFMQQTNNQEGASVAKVTPTPGDWFTSTIKDYRELACGSEVLANAEALVGNRKRLACHEQLKLMEDKGLNVSEFEMAKTIYTRMLFTPNASKLVGAANETDAKKMMLQLDQLQVMLNYRIYEMQEKLALIKSAQLATMVEGERTQPNASTPTDKAQ